MDIPIPNKGGDGEISEKIKHNLEDMQEECLKEIMLIEYIGRTYG